MNSRSRCNGSLVRHQGKLLLAYRRGWTKPEVWLCELADDWRVIDQRKLPLHADPAAGERWFSDPRLFVHVGSLYCASTAELFDQTSHQQHLARLDDRCDIVEQGILPQTGIFDKNWQFFSWEAQLFYVHRIAPQHQIRDLAGNLLYSTPANFAWNYGEPRGGTPPVRMGDEYVTFFHSHVDGRQFGVKKYYVAGYYAFEARPPFQITRAAAQPILEPVLDDMPRRHRAFCAAVYPCGALYDESGWLLSYGYHDREVRILRLPADLDAPRNPWQQGARVLLDETSTASTI